ncbi:MAG: glycosyltransferase family 2 protein [Candidatus Micrarchaeota archaeon]|nr:glycosyltransferase family 2 protein [Candidatus Micrarchaeota archaeon]
MLLLAFEAFVSLVFLALLAIDLLPQQRASEDQRKTGYNPRALVIVPCKGTDLTLKENLVSIRSQDFGRYGVIAVVDSEDDDAVPVIRSAKVRYIVSRRVSKMASGKVNAMLTAMSRFRDFDVYAIADSDITVGRMWLKELVLPLASMGTGLSTMFPVFEPKAGFWSKVKHVWGFVGEGLMKRDSTRFGWGGSMAFRKEMVSVKDIGFIKNSRYSVSDDICMTKIARAKGLGIAYTEASRPKVNSDDGFAAFAEWSTRQTALSILGYGRNFYYGIAFYSAEALVFLSGISLSIYANPVFMILFLHLVQSEVKAYIRSGRKDPEIAAIVAMMPFLYLANLFIANGKRSIKWRGSTYRIR